MNARSLMFASVVLSALACTGCGTTLTRGARAILSEQTADSPNVWVYLDTDDSEKSGVYRCRDVGEQVTCVKAKLVSR